jgi:transcriptional regulator with XRE-family HTH domain
MTDYTKLALGQALRDCRDRKRLTQKELAEQCGLTQTTVSEIENGKANPTLDVLQRLAESLGVPLVAFLGGGMILGTLGGILGAAVVGMAVGSLLGRNGEEGYEEWVASKLVEGLTATSRKKID